MVGMVWDSTTGPHDQDTIGLWSHHCVMKQAPEKILLIEVSFPADINVADKEGEKVRKYQRLAGEILRT